MPVDTLVGVFLKNKNLIDFYRKGIKPDPGVTFYFFYLNDIDFDSLAITGTCFDYNRGCWIKRVFPLPDVLYLRDNAAEQDRKRFEQFLKVINSSGVKLLNSLPEFDKWYLYQDLIVKGQIGPHLPETRLYRNDTMDLEQMLHQYGCVYLKACRGRQGRQVVRLKRLPGGYCEYSHLAGRLAIRKGRMDSKLFRAALTGIFNDAPYIIQQPIDLISYDGRHVDLRGELQRNRRGELEVVAVPVRIAMKNSPVTTHASSYHFTKFFAEMMGYNKDKYNKLYTEVSAFLVSIYLCVEEIYGPFGEIGIDLGLDRDGKLWLIECNAQPAKVSLTRAYNRDTVTRAFANPLDYALYTARNVIRANS